MIYAYEQLEVGVKMSPSKVVQFAEWSRFDPRLGELIVNYLKNHWPDLNPLLLRTRIHASVWPQSLAVILEHVESANPILPELFEHFKNLVLHGLSPAEYQSYTIGLIHPGSKVQFRQAQNPHPFFKKWGYYESAPFFNKFLQSSDRTLLKPAERKLILRNLLVGGRWISVNEYRQACNYAIHRRQAERDLKAFFNLKTRGRTRARLYCRA